MIFTSSEAGVALLAHLRAASIAMREDQQRVSPEATVAEIGNSGNTTAPICTCNLSTVSTRLTRKEFPGSSGATSFGRETPGRRCNMGFPV